MSAGSERFACSVTIPVPVPESIIIVPWGTVESTKGDFIVDAEAAAAVIDAFRAHGVDIPIDYEHTTIGGEFATSSGAAPAAGWIKDIQAAEGEGIRARVEWTERGAAHVASKEYRYLSPVFFVRKRDQRAVVLHSVAMTNVPAIRGMKPIVNSAAGGSNQVHHSRENHMDALRKALGLPDGADEQAHIAAVNRLKADAESAGAFRQTVCKAVNVEPDSEADQVTTIINSLRSSAKPTGDVVPKAEFEVVVNSLKETQTRLASLEATTTHREVADRIACAQREGKLTEAMLEPDKDGNNHFRTLARDPKEWDAFMSRQPVLAPPAGRVVANSQPRVSEGGEPSSRTVIIANAKSEFGENETRIACSQKAYIDEALRERDQKPLTEEEAAKV